MCASSDPLTAFLSFIPYGDRQQTATIIIALRKHLKEEIDSSDPVTGPLKQLKHLKRIFTHIPSTSRTALVAKAFEAIENCLDSPEAVSVFVLLLLVLELNTLRNSDRCDLESVDICKCISSVNSLVTSLSNAIDFRRMNLLLLRAWAVGTLVYTYRQCLLWCNQQDCIDFQEIPLEGRIPLDPDILNSPCLPKLLATVLDCQSNGKPLPVPKGEYLLNDLVMASAFSDITKNMVLYYNDSRSFSPLENKFDQLCVARLLSTPRSKEPLSDVPTPTVVKETLNSSNFPKIVEILKIIGRQLLDKAHFSIDFKDTCKELILVAPNILLSSCLKIDDQSIESKTTYCSLFCEFLRIWIYALDKRIVIDDIPQSDLYLGCFVNAKFQDMPLKGFVQAVNLQAQFLTTYLRVFRSNILASPHWFLQMISDSVTAVIDRLASAPDDESLSAIESAICPCIASLSRTWTSLRADEPDVRPQLSRAVKGLFDTIIVRIATSSAPQATSTTSSGRGDVKWRDSEGTAISERTIVGPRTRQMLENGLLFPLLDVIDDWALQQSRIGLKPATACEVLKKVVSRYTDKQAGMKRKMDGHPYLPPPVSHAAVSGLAGGRLKAKAGARRRNQNRRRF